MTRLTQRAPLAADSKRRVWPAREAMTLAGDGGPETQVFSELRSGVPYSGSAKQRLDNKLKMLVYPPLALRLR